MAVQEVIKFSTIEEVQKLLNIDEKSLSEFCSGLPITPRKDLKTGKAIFSKEDLDILKKAQYWYSKGESLTAIASKVKQPKSLASSLASKSDIAVVIEAVSQSRDGILAEISKIIDEKLEGMDEIVVELIKSKGELESIKHKLKIISDENDPLKYELKKFKHLRFGIYRRSNS